MRILIVIQYLIFIQCSDMISQSLKFEDINQSAIGKIYCAREQNKKLEDSGTGFVVGNGNIVITCAHVIDDCSAPIKFLQLGTNKTFTLQPMFNDSMTDLAYLVSDSMITTEPLHFKRNNRLVPMDTVLFIGYSDSLSSKHQVMFEHFYAVINSVGKTMRYGIVDYFEFISGGLPGFSGAPVFNMYGDVIGIWQGSWECKSYSTNRMWNMNRAFSLEPIYKEIKKYKP